MAEHGTTTKYINDKCRCDLCKTARKVYEEGRRMGRRCLLFTSAAPARKHAQFLLLNGWGSKTLGRRVGVSRHAIFNLVTGQTKLIKVETANKILGTSTFDAHCGAGGRKAQWKQEISA